MYVEIRKAGFTNKGAELMLYSIMDQVKTLLPDADLVMAPGINSSPFPYHRRAALGFYQKAWLFHRGFNLAHAAALAPKMLREMYGVVLDREIDVVLDAAGFAYGDQWGSQPSEELAKASRYWRKRGAKVVLLPQAFGPFKLSRSIAAVKEFVNNVELIYAREATSYKHLTGIVGEFPHIKIAPDFTNLIDGVVPEDFDANSHQLALVPNYRMVDKTGAGQGELYVRFLERVAGYLLSRDAKPFFLIHEGQKDLMLAEQVNQSLKNQIPIVTESNPLRIKGILGECKAAVGSRFHGLVSALSQGVPCIATGWSHKYQELFSDYDCPEGILSLDISNDDLRKALDYLIDPDSWTERCSTLINKSAVLQAQSREMWREVAALIASPEMGHPDRLL